MKKLMIILLIFAISQNTISIHAGISFKSVTEKDIAKVKIGDTAQEVKMLLGPPHRVFSEKEMPKVLSGKRDYDYMLGKKEAWLYLNAAQSPKIIFDPKGIESEVKIVDENIVYSPGRPDELIKEEHSDIEITIDQVISMQKTIQKSKGIEPKPDYMVVFVKNKVVEITQRKY